MTRTWGGRGGRGVRALKGLVAFALAAGAAGYATAHVRLRYAENGNPLFWESPGGVTLSVQRDGSDNVGDGSHMTAIRSAVEAWNDVEGSRARIVLDDEATERRDWQANDIRLVVFDENNSSGYFQGASSIVAITPVTFFTDGRIIDADVVFNGKNFAFTTSGEAGRFDIQDVAAHELGHFLGLDHSGVCGATMYPYVDTKIILHRSLAMDDKAGLRNIYPQGSFARVSGTLTRASDGTPVRGAHVVARDVDGHVAGAILSGANGVFTFEGLDPATYTIYADPLDQPVSVANLGGGQVIDTDFESAVLGTVDAQRGQVTSVGSHALPADVDLQLGRVSDDYPLRLVRGVAVDRLVRGRGLVAGSTLACSDATIALTNVAWSGTSVSFRAETPAGTPLGHVDLIVTDPAGDRDILVGGLEVTPPDPVVATVQPATGHPDGGTSVTISGAHFSPGLRVVIGDRIYREGDPDGCVLTDPMTITLDLDATIAGAHDVVVIDPTGVEGRLDQGFAVAAPPSIEGAFPRVGSASGGTVIRLTGANFVPDAQVTIDGVPQALVTVDSPTTMSIETAGGAPGGPYALRVTSPGGLTAETTFTYVPDPDPEISGVSPDEADRSGGTTVSIFGSGFTEDTRVLFGASTSTGTGGVTAPVQELLGSTMIRVVAPSSSVGTTSVVVRNEATGQVAAVPAAFTYTGTEEVDDGGGCAATLPAPGPPTWRRVLGGAGWILAAVLCALLRLRQSPSPRVASARLRGAAAVSG